MQPHSRLHNSYPYLVAILLVASGSALAGNGPGGPACSPLAGPCVANRITYGYFPTKWRRWPTAEFAMAPPAMPEVVPTPAVEPEDEPDLEAAPEFDPDLPPPLPTDDLPEPAESELPSEAPFTSPPLGEMPGSDTTTPAPQSTTPPPFGDVPGLPGEQATPSPAAPGGDQPAQPPTDLFEAPSPTPAPAMPDDDPFKDDPEPAPNPTGESGGSMQPQSAEVASQPALIPALEQVPRQNTAAVAESRSLVAQRGPAEEPRMLAPAEETERSAPLPRHAPVSNNPLRTSSTVIRQTSLAPAADFAPARPATVERAWRTNPLRGR